MGLQLIPLLAVPLGAGLGWLAGKALEANADSVVEHSKRIVGESIEYVEIQRKEYERLRLRFLAKLETFSTVLSSSSKRIPARRARNRHQLPPELEAAWQKIANNSIIVFPENLITGLRAQGWDSRINLQMMAASHQVNHGNPIQGAAVAATAMARRGWEHRDQAGNYRNDAKAAAAMARQAADASVAAIRIEIEQIETDWEDLITPLLNDALQKNDGKCIQELIIWSERIESRSRQWVITTDE